LARELLDRHWLQTVRVESTDLGDHYDPVAKAVRLSRDKIDRRSLTAVTTAAHEVAHAMQDASGYGPFVWRNRLVKVAQVTGNLGAVLFLAVPVTAVLTRHPVPAVFVGFAALAMLGTGVVAQLAALPSELDASFTRALPMLREGYIGEEQLKDARKILLACSLTYVASTLVAILYIWPWIGGPPMASPALTGSKHSDLNGHRRTLVHRHSGIGQSVLPDLNRVPKRKNPSMLGSLIRPIGKPLIRAWFRIAGVA
jgi:hypothetical protein